MPKYNYKADALTDFFKGKLSAKELDKIARNDFGSGVATKKELSNFLSNKFTQDVMSDTYGIPAGTLVKRVRDLMKFAESVNEDKFYNTRVQYTDPKSKKKFVGDVVRKDGDEYKVNLGKDGRFEKYILAKAKDLKIVSKSKKRTYEAIGKPTISKPFKSGDRTFDKVYDTFDKKDYFNSKGLAKVQIGNFERALKKNDKGAQQVLDMFKGDEKKAKDYITQVISDRNKERAFNNYKALKSAVDSIQKGKPNVGAVDYVKRIIHNSSQKYSIALYSTLRNKKFTKWKDVHDDIDSLIGESVNENNKLFYAFKDFFNGFVSREEPTLGQMAKRYKKKSDFIKWFVKSQAKMGVVFKKDGYGAYMMNRIGRIWDRVHGKPEDKKYVGESVNEGSMDWEKHFKGYNEKELKVISKLIFMNPQGIDGVIKMSKKKDFKPFIKKAAKKGLGESVNENTKKSFEVDFYKGNSDRQTSHEEIIRGDKFSDIVSKATKIAKSKGMSHVEFHYKDAFIGSIDKRNNYSFKKGRGFSKSPLSVNEATKGDVMRAVKGRPNPYTLVVIKRGDVIYQKNIKNPQEVPAVYSVIRKHMDKGERIHIEDRTGKIVFKEGLNEAYVVLYSPKKGVKPVTTAAYKDKKDAEKWAKDLGGITMIVKKKVKGIDESKKEVEQIAKKTKSEKAFYDVLDKVEKRYGKRNFELWLDKSLKDLKVNPKKYKTSASKQEALYQLTK